MPRFSEEPAVLPALWSRLSDGVIAAPAAGASERTPTMTAAAVEASDDVPHTGCSLP
jgi:hypothetical protein